MRRLALLLVLLLAACGDDAPPPAQAAAGPPLELVLEDLDGLPVDLAAYRGKVVLLNVWATWCPPCRREMPGLQKLADQMDPAKVAVLGVAIDKSPALVREYLRGRKLPFAKLVDRGGEITYRELDVLAVPATFVLDREGRVVWAAAGERDWGDPQAAAWLRKL